MGQNQVDRTGQNEQNKSLDRQFRIVAEAFSELFELLEQYAPTWYTEQHHNRGLTARLIVEKFQEERRGDDTPSK